MVEVRRHTAQVVIQRGLFLLLDANVEPNRQELPVPGELFRGTANWLAIATGCEDGKAEVTLEQWDAEPLVVDRVKWEVVADTVFLTGSGEVIPSSFVSNYLDEPFNLGVPGYYHLRICGRGRSEAMQIFSRPDSTLSDLDGVEQYRLQLWRRRE